MADAEVLWLDASEQLSQAAGVTARAMRDSPYAVAVSNDPFVRLEMLYSTFGELLGDARVAGVRRGDCVLGAAAALPPGHCIASLLPEEVRTSAPSGLDASDAERFLYCGSVMAANDPDEPHWHVGPVGVEPGFQGRGLGRAAMGLLCEELDEHHQVAWLETEKPENVRFYLGLGFEVVDEVPMLAARFWFMRRAAA